MFVSLGKMINLSQSDEFKKAVSPMDFILPMRDEKVAAR